MSRDNCAISCCSLSRGSSGVALLGFSFNIRVLCELEKKDSSYDHEDAVNAATGYKTSETNSIFHVKQRTTGKNQYLFFRGFLLALTKYSLQRRTQQ